MDKWCVCEMCKGQGRHFFCSNPSLLQGRATQQQAPRGGRGRKYSVGIALILMKPHGGNAQPAEAHEENKTLENEGRSFFPFFFFQHKIKLCRFMQCVTSGCIREPFTGDVKVELLLRVRRFCIRPPGRLFV